MVTFRLVPELHLVLSQLAGKVDYRQLSEATAELAKETEHLDAVHELSDCRGITDMSDLRVGGLVALGREEAGMPGLQGGRLAILVASEAVYGMARAFSVHLAGIRQILITYSSREAVDFFGLDPDGTKLLLDLLEQE